MNKHVLVTVRVWHNKLLEPVTVMIPLEKGHLETLKRLGRLERHIINEASNYIKKELEIINITERESDRFDEFLESMREDKELENE